MKPAQSQSIVVLIKRMAGFTRPTIRRGSASNRKPLSSYLLPPNSLGSRQSSLRKCSSCRHRRYHLPHYEKLMSDLRYWRPRGDRDRNALDDTEPPLSGGDRRRPLWSVFQDIFLISDTVAGTLVPTIYEKSERTNYRQCCGRASRLLPVKSTESCPNSWKTLDAGLVRC